VGQKKVPVKKSGVFLRRTRSELLRPPLICGLLSTYNLKYEIMYPVVSLRINS
jgi:hypothetical protein